MEDFSLNLLCRGKSHLLSQTLDSLKAQKASFEVLLLDGERTGRLHEVLKGYEGLNIRIESSGSISLAKMMNLGLKCSTGKYIQFLEPGERYISQYGLSYLTEQIVKEPQLISSRGVIEKTLSHWFLRSKLLEMGGFNEKVYFRPMFDLLCRYQREGIQSYFCSRVLIDLPGEPKASSFETWKILYRHFGLSVACKWMFQGHSQTFHRAASFVKESFWRGD